MPESQPRGHEPLAEEVTLGRQDVRVVPMTSWLFVVVDAAGDVSFGGMSTPTNAAFKLVLNANRAYFRLRHQYQK
jgi:hypothetical protein